MALHAAADLLVHADDAHRHLWPLSDWRFASPVSYWDPRHHGAWFAPVECVAALAMLAAVRRRAGRRTRVALAALAVAYVAALGAATARLVRPELRGAGSLQQAVTGRR